MNIHPKFSQSDLAGVVGLLAFLADPAACKARLEELTAEAEKAYAAQTAAQAAVNAEAEQAKLAEGKLAEAAALRDKALAAAQRNDERAKELASREAEVGRREAAVKNAQSECDAVAARLDAQAAALDERAAAVKEAEDKLAADRLEFDRKVSQLRALAQ